MSRLWQWLLAHRELVRAGSGVLGLNLLLHELILSLLTIYINILHHIILNYDYFSLL